MAEKKSYFSLWAQVNPAGGYEFLTCVGITGNIVIPEGEATLTYCPSVMSGEYEPDLMIDGEPGLVTLSLEQPLDHVFNWTLELRCRPNLRLNYVCGADRNVFGGYRLGTTIFQAKRMSGNIADPTALAPGDDARVNTTADFAGLLAAYVKKLTGTRQGLTQTQDVNDIDFLPAMCWSDCGIYTDLGANGYAVLDTDYAGVYGDTVLHTVNSGGTWTPTTTSPFLTLGRNAMAVKTRWIGNGTHRVIVAGGAMAATYPEISYSDDAGLVWTDVNPSTAVGGQGIAQMCWDQLGRLWAVATGGYIYVSTNLGESYSTSENGGETTQNLNDIVFYNANVGYAVGNSNAFLRTTDGGTWAAITGPAAGQNLLTCCVNRYGHVFVGTNAAGIWRSVDQGANWTEIVDLGAGSISMLRADPRYRYFIGATWNDAGNLGLLYRSEDGGNSFTRIATPANVGLDALFVGDQNTIFVGGLVTLLTSYIARFIRQV